MRAIWDSLIEGRVMRAFVVTDEGLTTLLTTVMPHLKLKCIRQVRLRIDQPGAAHHLTHFHGGTFLPQVPVSSCHGCDDWRALVGTRSFGQSIVHNRLSPGCPTRTRLFK